VENFLPKCPKFCHHYNAGQRYCEKMQGGKIIAWQKCAGKNYQPMAFSPLVFFSLAGPERFSGVHGMGVD